MSLITIRNETDVTSINGKLYHIKNELEKISRNGAVTNEKLEKIAISAEIISGIKSLREVTIEKKINELKENHSADFCSEDKFFLERIKKALYYFHECKENPEYELAKEKDSIGISKLRYYSKEKLEKDKKRYEAYIKNIWMRKKRYKNTWIC